MQKIKIKVLILAGLLSSSVLAHDTYFGVGIGQTKIDGGSVEGVTVSDYKKINYKLLAGLHLNTSFAVELQYVKFAKDDVSVSDGVNSVAVSVSGRSIGVAGLYHFAPQANFSPFVKLGLHNWDLEAAAAGVTVDDDGTDLFYGVGIDGKINDDMKYRLEFERMKADDDDIDNIGVALLFDF